MTAPVAPHIRTRDITDEQVVQAAQHEKRTGERLMEITGCCTKVALCAIERAYSRRFVEIGIGAWWAFPTPKGLDLLAGTVGQPDDYSDGYRITPRT